MSRIRSVAVSIIIIAVVSTTILGAQQMHHPTLSASLSDSRPPKHALSEPFGIAFDPTNNNVYVANFGSNTVSVIDGRNNKITHAISVGTNPNQVAYDPANQEIYVSDSGSTTVSAISSTDNNIVATIATDPVTPSNGEYGPFWLAFNPTNDEMYVTNYNFPSSSNTVVAINSTTNTVAATVTVGQNPIRLAYDPSNGCIYVADYSSGQISVISPSNRVVATISVPGNPDFVGYDPGNSEIYVASNNSNQVTAISSATNMVVATINIGGNPYGATYDPANGEMFVSASINAAVYAINSATNTVAAIIPANNPHLPGPYTLTYDPANGYIYVSNTNDNSFSPSTVSVISATNSIIANVPTGAKPDQSIYDPANNNMYVVNQNSDSVTVIDSGNIIVATIGTSTPPTPPPPPPNSDTPPSIFLLQPFLYRNCVSINGAMNPTTPGAILGPASWSWGDGSTTTSWFPATHSYATTGTYLVQVTATDSNGLKAATSTTVDVTGSTVQVPPQLTIFSPAITGKTITVNGVANSNACQSQPLQPFSFNWGDGIVGTGWFPQSHTYNSSGNFQVCVTATDSFGATTTKCELAAVQ
jgi:YVTN family beta-propeller protein